MFGLEQRLFGCGKNVYWRPVDYPVIAKRFGVDIANLPLSLARDIGGHASSTAAPAVRSSDKIAGPFPFVLSSKTLDAYGDTVRQEGIRYERFDRNPTALGFHDSSTLPIGKWTNRRIEDGKLKASLTFSEDYFAQRVARSVQERMLVGASIGFRPIEWEFSSDKSRPYGIDFHVIELYEASLTATPANPDCLLGAMPSSKSFSFLNDECEDDFA